MQGPVVTGGAEVIFGVRCEPELAGVRLLPIPFEATVSYRGGTGLGPAAILAASPQLDLRDRRFGDIWKAGIALDDPGAWVEGASRDARRAAAPIIERGEAGPGDEAAVALVDDACQRVRDHAHAWTAGTLGAGRIPGIIGGEHGVCEGAITAAADRFGEIGLLQIDAHMDLRPAYQGFARSHASVMRNVLAAPTAPTRLVQVGIRDFCEQEQADAEADERVSAVYADDLFDRLAGGEPLVRVWREVVEMLPENVWVSFDIDGLEPHLCPGTGTPVPGGLEWREASLLLATLIDSGRRVVGFDLVEVAPDPDDDPAESVDAIVGARVLYRLCGAAVRAARA